MNFVYTEISFTSRLTFKWEKHLGFASSYIRIQRVGVLFAESGKHFHSILAHRIDNLKFIFLERLARTQLSTVSGRGAYGVQMVSRLLSKVFFPPIVDSLRTKWLVAELNIESFIFNIYPGWGRLYIFPFPMDKCMCSVHIQQMWFLSFRFILRRYVQYIGTKVELLSLLFVAHCKLFHFHPVTFYSVIIALFASSNSNHVRSQRECAQEDAKE